MKDSSGTPSGGLIPSGWGVWLFRAEIKQASKSDFVLIMRGIEYCVNKYSPTALLLNFNKAEGT